MANRHLQHIKSSQANKIPDENDLLYGEIAVNYAEGSETLYIKNSNNDIVPFVNGNKIEESEMVIAQALSDLDERVTENASAIDSMSGLSDRMTQAESDITEIRETIDENEEITAGALADLDARLTSEATAREALERAVEDNERVIAQGMAQLDEQISDLNADLSEEASAREALAQVVEDNELVAASALTELRQQIAALELEIQSLRNQMA